MLVSIMREFEPTREPNELRVQHDFHLRYRLSRSQDSVFFLCLRTCPMSIEWTDQFMYLRDQDSVFCNLLAYNRLASGTCY
jgi:hypothetical protein